MENGADDKKFWKMMHASISEANKRNPHVIGLNSKRNYGHKKLKSLEGK